MTANVDGSTGGYDVHIAGAVRPYTVLNASRFVKACHSALKESPLSQLGTVGSVDQLSRPTDEMIHFTDWSARLEAIYRAKLDMPART